MVKLIHVEPFVIFLKSFLWAKIKVYLVFFFFYKEILVSSECLNKFPESFGLI